MKKEDNLQKIKRFKSAYIFYCEDNRSRLRNDHPNMTSLEIIKQLGEEWKSLQNKEVYYAKEAIERNKFNQLKKSCKYSYIKRTTPKKPKRFRTPFMLYLKDRKDYVKLNGTFVDNLKEIGKQWKLLPNNEKLTYITMSNNDKNRYKIEYLEYINQVMKQKETKKDQRMKMIKLFEETAKVFKDETNIFHLFSKGKEIKDNESYDNLVMIIKEIFKDNKEIELLKKKYLEVWNQKQNNNDRSSSIKDNNEDDNNNENELIKHEHQFIDDAYDSRNSHNNEDLI